MGHQLQKKKRAKNNKRAKTRWYFAARYLVQKQLSATDLSTCSDSCDRFLDVDG